MIAYERLLEEMKRIEELGQLAVQCRAMKQARMFSNALYSARASFGNEMQMIEEAGKLARLRQAYEQPTKKFSRVFDA